MQNFNLLYCAQHHPQETPVSTTDADTHTRDCLRNKRRQGTMSAPATDADISALEKNVGVDGLRMCECICAAFSIMGVVDRVVSDLGRDELPDLLRTLAEASCVGRDNDTV